MKVREAMTSEVGVCQPTTGLAAAAILMWQRDCGVVPVVDEQQRVIGMITDRDVCMAAMMKNRPVSEILVGEVISGTVKTCAPNEDLEDALKKMKKSQVRRLPVVNRDGTLVGIISLSDVLRNAKEVSRKKLVAALQEISHYHPVTLHPLDSEAINDARGDVQHLSAGDANGAATAAAAAADADEDEVVTNFIVENDADESSDENLAADSNADFPGNSHDVSENVYGANDQAQL